MLADFSNQAKVELADFLVNEPPHISWLYNGNVEEEAQILLLSSYLGLALHLQSAGRGKAEGERT